MLKLNAFASCSPSDIMQRSLPTMTHQVFQHISSTFGVIHVIGLHLFMIQPQCVRKWKICPFLHLVCHFTANNRLM